MLAHGAPERLEDVESYLSYVRGGRPGSPKILEEVRSRYQAIGGSSPLLKWTRAQAEALRFRLLVPRQAASDAPSRDHHGRQHAQAQECGHADLAAGVVVEREHPCSFQVP